MAKESGIKFLQINDFDNICIKNRCDSSLRLKYDKILNKGFRGP